MLGRGGVMLASLAVQVQATGQQNKHMLRRGAQMA